MRNLTKSYLALIVLLLFSVSASGQTKRLLEVDDIFNVKSVGSPRISPDGAWVAYTVSAMNKEDDNSDTDIYMSPYAGGDAIRVTTGPKGESGPKWSSDGKYLAFTSARDDEGNQVWLLDRRDGEATRLTDFEGGLSSFEWSPDSTRLLITRTDPDPKAEEKKKAKAPEPLVVTRLQFKRDGRGYLHSRKTHLHIFELEGRTSFQLTHGEHDSGGAVWSPDGRWVAFVSNRTSEPDANRNSDLWVIRAQEGAKSNKITEWRGSDSSPAWSPDGGHLAYIQGGNPEDIWYATNNLAVVAISNGDSQGSPRILPQGVDRNLSSPDFTPDGRYIRFLIEDRKNRHLARVPAAGGDFEFVTTGERSIRQFDSNAAGQTILLESRLSYPSEVSRLEGSSIQRISRVNDEFLAGIELARVETTTAASRDGTEIDLFLTHPPRAGSGPHPALLRIHGGPVSQFSNSFSFEWQLLAAKGFLVVSANPRGSSGRGSAFSRAIRADWGQKDFQDVMAAVDKAIEMGLADKDRLGVGGWSYGGILTNYVITQTDRFKAAISGASEVNYTANYGHDHYQLQWEKELGLPWENPDAWIRISPFFKVGNVVTPTLIMCGQLDWNVPLQNSEQLYQALRRLGRETELVIYPGQGHGIRRPSYQVDRYQRYLDWYNKYLRPEASEVRERGREN